MDWGTSNFRAFLMDGEGTVVARQSSPRGILQVDKGGFAETLRGEIGDWLAEGENQILLCGMVGSRQGWVEAGYLPCPVGIEELADSVVEVSFPGAKTFLVRGVMGADAEGVPEVMRGEETAAMGVLDDSAGLVCFPGTHSKWVRLSDRKIVRFTTSMTGELYSALGKSTILGRTMTSSPVVERAAFEEGVIRSADAGGLLHHLFGVRTRVLMGELKEESSASYLSGLLIGHEVRATMPAGARVLLVGAAQLCGLYAQVIAACGGQAKLEDEDAAALGLAAVGRRLGWI